MKEEKTTPPAIIIVILGGSFAILWYCIYKLIESLTNWL